MFRKRRFRFLVPMDAEEFGLWLCYKYNVKFNYYIFVEGINVFFTFIALILFAIVWYFTESISFPDPLESIKQIYLNWQFISIMLIALSLILISILSKNKEKLRKHLIFTFLVTIILLVELIGVKSVFDNTYTDEKFAQLYETEIENKRDKTYYDVEFSDGKLQFNEKTEKDKYIEDIRYEYNKFNVKVIIGDMLLVLIGIFNAYMILKVQQKIESIEKLNQDDVVVYDDKIDVKTGGYMTFEEYKKMKEQEKRKQNN